MASGGEENITEIVINDEAHNFSSLLSSFERDFLVRNNGDQVLFYSVNFFFIEWLLMGVLLKKKKKVFLHLSVWLSKLFDGHVMWTFGFIHPIKRIGWWDFSCDFLGKIWSVREGRREKSLCWPYLLVLFSYIISKFSL